MKSEMKNTFALIGASRTGVALAYHLAKAGWIPEFLWNRSRTGLERADTYIHFQNSSLELSDISRKIDWIIIAVSDDAIHSIAGRISRLFDSGAGIQVIHLSGAWDAGLLNDLKGKGFRTGSLHPLVSVPDMDIGIREMGRAVFSCEGDLAGELQGLADKIGGKGIILNAEQKALVHLSAVFVNNFQTALIQSLKQLAESRKIPESKLEILLKTLSRQSRENAWKKSLEDSLTGPVVRDDRKTIARHLKELEQVPELKRIYEDYVELTRKLLQK